MVTTVQLKEISNGLPGCVRLFARGGRGLLALMGLACLAAVAPASAEEQLTSVTSWHPTMTQQGEGEVLIAYTPPLSSERQYPGANFQSDGKVMVVSLRSCLVHEECPTLKPAQARAAADRTRWYEVAVPYRGEKVIVEGDGPGKQELALIPSAQAVVGNSSR